MEDQIIVKKYLRKEFLEFPRSDYQWDITYGTLNKDISLYLKNILRNIRRERFVAYDKKNNIMCGTIYIEKITNSTWGIWGAYVSPKARGKGISSLLYNSCFYYLSNINVKTLVGMVSSNNISSIRSINKVFNGYLNQHLYEFSINVDKIPNSFFSQYNLNIIKPIYKYDINKLNKFYISNMDEKFLNTLDINKDNFLNRSIKTIKSRGVASLLYNNSIYIQYSDDNICGFSIRRNILFKNNPTSLYLTVSRELFYEDLLMYMIKLVYTFYKNGIKSCIIYLNNINANMANQIKDFFVEYLNAKYIDWLIPFKNI